MDISLPGWVGCALAFLALCKVGFVSGFCVPCNVYDCEGLALDGYQFIVNQ